MSFRRDWVIATLCLLVVLGIVAGLGLVFRAPEALRTAPLVAAVGSAADVVAEGVLEGEPAESDAVILAMAAARPVSGRAPKPPLPPAARILGTAATVPMLSAADRGELRCLALNIYFEARNEPLPGQIAVAHVVLNRVADRAFPDTICGVVRQGGDRRRHRCQFSWWCDGRSDRPREEAAWRHSLQLAHAIYRGHLADPTEGAKWYHAVYVTPDWRQAFRQGPRIGRHIFYQAAS